MMAAVRGCPPRRGPVGSCRGADASRTTGVPLSGARDGGWDGRAGVGRPWRRADAKRSAGAGDATRGGRLRPRAACRRIDVAPRQPRRCAHRRLVDVLAPFRSGSRRDIAAGLVDLRGADRRGSSGLRDVGGPAGDRSGVGGADRRRSRGQRPLWIGGGAVACAGDRARAVAADCGARDLLRGAASRRWRLFLARASALALTQL